MSGMAGLRKFAKVCPVLVRTCRDENEVSCDEYELVDGFTFDPPFKDIADVFAATDAEHVEPPVQIFEGMNPEDSTCR